MSYSLRSFEFSGSTVRVVEENGEPWFVANDLSEPLGLERASNAARKILESDELHVDLIPTKRRGKDTKRKMLLVSESGLYTLIMRSRKAQATKFRQWVTGEVLPIIRKTGSYERSSRGFPELSEDESVIKREKMTMSVNVTTRNASLTVSIAFNSGVEEKQISEIRRGIAEVVKRLQADA